MPVLKALGNLLKKKPDIPDIKPIDTEVEQRKATQGNLANFNLISDLTKRSNELGLSESLKVIDSMLGGGARDQIQSNIKAGLGGELPQDVIDFVRRNAAETSTAGGFGGSQAGANLTLRDLGLTSLQRTDQALDAAGRWLATAGSGIPQFNFSGMFITPGQQLAQANVNQQNKFQRDLLSTQVDAAFSSGTIFGNMLGDMDDTIVELASSYVGGLGGGPKKAKPPPPGPPPPGGGGGGFPDYAGGGSGIGGNKWRSPGFGDPGGNFGGFA